MDYIVHGVTKSWTRLSDFHHLKECQKEGMATRDLLERF